VSIDMNKRYEPLAGYDIAGCAAFDKNLVSLWGQQWSNSDSLEQRLTCTFFFYADEPEADQWAFSGIGGATGIHGCAGLLPSRQWIYVMDDGEVYAVGGGADHFEAPIVQGRPAYFTNVRCLRSGEVLAVGGRRKVYLREGEGRWTPFGQGQFPQGTDADMTDAGFRDIDGFGLDELYAVGGRGDAWVCLAGQWQPIDLGTNVGLKRVLCARDGQVYIATDREDLYVGRKQTWQRITNEVTNEIHESLVDFEGRVLLSTSHHLLEISQGVVAPAVFPGMPVMNSMAHLGVGGGVLVVAGKDEAVMFDGSTWQRFLDPQP
jgi:hypothetical protein